MYILARTLPLLPVNRRSWAYGIVCCPSAAYHDRRSVSSVPCLPSRRASPPSHTSSLPATTSPQPHGGQCDGQRVCQGMGSGIRGIWIYPRESGCEERFRASRRSGEDCGNCGRASRTGGDEKVDVEFKIAGSVPQSIPNLRSIFHPYS